MNDKKIAVALCLSAMWLIGSAHAETQDVQIIKIGSGAPLSGGIAHLGQDNELGAQLAINDINAKGNLLIGGKHIRLELVSGDDEGDVTAGLAVAQKMVDAGVVAVVAHLNSGISMPANTIYAANGLVQVSPSSTNRDYTLKSTRMPSGHVSAYRVLANDNRQGPALVNALTEHSKIKTALMIGDNTEYAARFIQQTAQALLSKDVHVIHRYILKPSKDSFGVSWVTPDDVDFKVLLKPYQTQQPDLIIYGGMDDVAAKLAVQMKQLGFRSLLVSDDGACVQNFIDLAGDAANDMRCSIIGMPLDKMPKEAEFTQHFSQSFTGKKVELYAPFAYDAVYAIVEAMKLANSTDKEAIAAAMPKVDFEGVTGRIRFDANGDLVNGAVGIFKVKDKRLVIDQVAY